jgi:LysM repeat protein
VHTRNVVATIVVLAAFGVAVPCAVASQPHVVQPGETMWSIAAANNLTTRTVAVFNGLSEDSQVVAGHTLDVPTVAEGAAALAEADTAAAAPVTDSGASHAVAWGESLSSIAAANGIAVDQLAAANGLSSDAYLIEGEAIQIPGATASSAASVPPGSGEIPSAAGTLYLRPDAADAWNAMSAEALSLYGVELQPQGPLSAYRSYDQQAELYDRYLSGAGAPANPPGSSSHEHGVAVDVATPEMRSIVDEIGGRFGWGKVHAPGEWWHVDYVGG